MTLPGARVGLIIPSSNRMVEGEMVRWFPNDVQAHVNRLRMTGSFHGPLEKLLPRITESAGALADARCDVVAFHCTATAMEDGPAGEEAIVDALRAGAHERVTTTATAIRRALDALEAKRIVLVTPYDAATTAHEVAYLNGAGYEVVRSVATDRGGSDGYCSTPPEFWYETACANAHPDADVYFIGCANIAVFEQIDRLERTLGKPVITSNQTVIWDALRMSRTNEVPATLGRLFGKLPATVSR